MQRELIESLAAHAPLDYETLANVVDALSGCEEAVIVSVAQPACWPRKTSTG